MNLFVSGDVAVSRRQRPPNRNLGTRHQAWEAFFCIVDQNIQPNTLTLSYLLQGKGKFILLDMPFISETGPREL